MSRHFRALKQQVKGYLKRLRSAYIERFLGFDTADLTALLERLGLRTGDVVLVHVAFNSFSGFQGGPGDVIRVLQSVVGELGTLLMPTMPFSGSAVEYARQYPRTDLAKSPSAMGIVTEIFRRMPGVIRSIHPTHSVAAWGARAEELTGDHFRAESPCGRNSPFLRLLDVDGKILFLGAEIQTMTFYHGLEELFEDRLPASPFTREWFALETRDRDGNTWTTKTRLFDPDLSRRRDIGPLEPHLRRIGAWHQGKVGRLRVSLVRAHDVRDMCEQLADRGVFFYGRHVPLASS
jgi:aminoglycoside 3-N-acetyltransferase